MKLNREDKDLLKRLIDLQLDDKIFPVSNEMKKRLRKIQEKLEKQCSNRGIK